MIKMLVSHLEGTTGAIIMVAFAVLFIIAAVLVPILIATDSKVIKSSQGKI